MSDETLARWPIIQFIPPGLPKLSLPPRKDPKGPKVLRAKPSHKRTLSYFLAYYMRLASKSTGTQRTEGKCQVKQVHIFQLRVLPHNTILDPPSSVVRRPPREQDFFFFFCVPQLDLWGSGEQDKLGSSPTFPGWESEFDLQLSTVKANPSLRYTRKLLDVMLPTINI